MFQVEAAITSLMATAPSPSASSFWDATNGGVGVIDTGSDKVEIK
jgi:hypothetical protein